MGLQNGFIIMGLSQGGLLARGVIENHVGPAGYFHRIDDESSYFKSGTILADLNNVGETKNEQYKQRMSQLDAMVMIMFSEDTMVIPKETAHFGFFKDSKRQEIVALEDIDVYHSDLI